MFHAVQVPSISLSFNLRSYYPGGSLNALATARGGRYSSNKRSSFRAWTTGYLIPFATHAFVFQRQECSSLLPSLLCSHDINAFHRYTMIPRPSHLLAMPFRAGPRLSRRINARLTQPPTHPLRPIIPDNA